MLMIRNKKLSWFELLLYAFMCFFCISILLPFWDMLLLSVSDPKQNISLTLRLWPETIKFDAYEFAFRNNRIMQAYLITIYRTVCGTALTLVLTVMAAYPLSKRDLPFRNYITTFFIIPMFFGGGMIPTYLLMRSLGLIDNLLVYIVGAVGVFNVLLVRNFMMSQDKSLEESAFIDGAGYARMLFAIIIPLSKPILATIALWSAVGHWNAWFDSLIYIRSENKQVLQLILQQLLKQVSSTLPSETMDFTLRNPGKFVTSKTFQAALTVITIGPIVAIYPFFQRYFVKGIMVGSLKG